MIPENKPFVDPFPTKIKQNKIANSNKLGVIFLYLLIVGMITLYMSIAYEETFKIEKIFTKMFNHLL